MKQNAGERAPRARKEGLVVQELPDEVLVYDRERDKAHCLNNTAALIWKYSDGNSSVEKITQQLERDLNSPVDEKMVWYALDQLSKDHLLEEDVVPAAMFAGMNRRALIRTLGIAAVVAVPVITSIVAPTPAQAVTCTPTGGACTTGANCCSGQCNPGNVCA